jgi:hypothetical protein
VIKYHLNPFSGEPKVCKATVGKCPWGGPADHYESESSARGAYEIQKQNEVLPSPVKTIEINTSFITNSSTNNPTYGLSKEEANAISTDGIECPDCSQQLSSFQASYILDISHAVDCFSCGKAIDLYNVNLTVPPSKSTYAAYEKENVYKMTWYHSTTSDDWTDYLEKDGGFYAHLGGLQASFDRQLAEGSDSFWVYEVKVEEEATIYDEVAEDENENYSTAYSPGGNNPLSHDVVRYVNKWEDMASISLVANSNKVRILSKRLVSASESRTSKSLYNIRDKDFLDEANVHIWSS